MEIYLIRHAQPEWIRDECAVVDPPLTERGVRQAEAVADALVEVHFDEILMSPLQRPQLTARPLLDRTSAQASVANWLEEIREPDWHGLPATVAADAFAEERNLPAEARWGGIPGGESPRDFAARVQLGCAKFLEERGVVRTPQPLPVWTMDESDRRIALFAHAGTNGIVLCHLLGIEPVPWEWDRLATWHASITRLETMRLGDGYTFMLTMLSSLEHLAPGDRTR